MLATQQAHRGKGIAGNLVCLAVDAMKAQDADEIALETEVDNIPSLRIYEKLGFIRTKRLHRYYLSGTSAFRLILYLKPGIPYMTTYSPEYGGPMDYGEAGELGYGGGGGIGLGEEDLIERQVAQMRIEDVYGERHDVRGV